MSSITLIFSRNNRRLRRDWLDGLLAGNADHLPDSLVLVPDAIAGQAARRLIRHGKAAFSPTVQSLGTFLGLLVMRAGDGTAPLPALSHALLAEEVLQASPGRWPWLASVPTDISLGRSLADLHDETLEAGSLGLASLEAPHGAELDDFMAALDRRIADMGTHRPMASLLKPLVHELEAPSPALEAQLCSAALVLCLGIEELSPLRRTLLIALLRAWRRSGVHSVMTLPAGPASLLWEPDAFFGRDPFHPQASWLRSIQSSAPLRRQLFDELVVSGEARVVLCTGQGLQPVEPLAIPDPNDPPGLAEAAEVPIPSKLRIWRCADDRHELLAIARDLKEALREGTDPTVCVVALADLDERREVFLQILQDHGIPVELPGGSRLANSPVVTTLLALAHLPEVDFAARDLLSFLESDLVRCTPPIQPRRLRKLVEAAGIRTGVIAAWHAPLTALLRRRGKESHEPETETEAAILRITRQLEALEDMKSWMSNVGAPGTPAEYAYRLLEVADRLRIPGRAGRTREDPAIAADALASLGAFHRLLKDMVDACRLVNPEIWSAERLRAILDEAVANARRPPQARMGGVSLVPLSDLPLIGARRIWAGGMTRGRFPCPDRDSFLVPRRLSARLGRPDPAAHARAILARMIHEVEDEGLDSLVLSWPATREGQLSPPAPVLADILTIRIDGVSIDKRAILPTWPVDEPRSATDLLRLAARHVSWRSIHPDSAALSLQAECVAAREDRSDLGPWDGRLEAPPPVPDPMRVTSLETYLRCPARLFYQAVIGLEEPEIFDPELAAARKGRLVHRVLELFLGEISKARAIIEGLDPGDRTQEASRLARILDRLVEEERIAGAAHPFLLAHQARQWASGLADSAAWGILRNWLEAEADREWGARPTHTEIAFRNFQLGSTNLAGKVDRMDALRDGSLVVIDYKTGFAPGTDHIRRGLAIQPVIYAEAMRQRTGRDEVVAVYQEVRDAGRLKYAGWYGNPNTVKRLSGRSASASLEEGEAVLAHAAAGVERWSQGLFHTTLADPDDVGCFHCSFRRICRADPQRDRARREAGVNMQAPLDEGDDP